MKMINNPYKIVKLFENEISNFTGSKYAISTDSCTNALFLICKYLKVQEVTIPSKTYLSVPQSIIHAGGEVIFDRRDKTNKWSGLYQLKPYPIYDSAKRLKKGMYIKGSYMSLSFHIKKQLPSLATSNIPSCLNNINLALSSSSSLSLSDGLTCVAVGI